MIIDHKTCSYDTDLRVLDMGERGQNVDILNWMAPMVLFLNIGLKSTVTKFKTKPLKMFAHCDFLTLSGMHSIPDRR